MKLPPPNVARRRLTPARCADAAAPPAMLWFSPALTKNLAASVLEEVSVRVLAEDPGSSFLRYVYGSSL